MELLDIFVYSRNLIQRFLVKEIVTKNSSVDALYLVHILKLRRELELDVSYLGKDVSYMEIRTLSGLQFSWYFYFCIHCIQYICQKIE